MSNVVASATWSSKLSWAVVGGGDYAISAAIMAAYRAGCFAEMIDRQTGRQIDTEVGGGGVFVD